MPPWAFRPMFWIVNVIPSPVLGLAGVIWNMKSVVNLWTFTGVEYQTAGFSKVLPSPPPSWPSGLATAIEGREVVQNRKCAVAGGPKLDDAVAVIAAAIPMAISSGHEDIAVRIDCRSSPGHPDGGGSDAIGVSGVQLPTRRGVP